VVLLALLLIVPTLLGEATVRALIATHRLAPAAAHFSTLEISWADLDRTGAVDVLIMGESTTHSGIDPALLAELASKAIGQPVRAFNLGIPGLAGEPSLLEQLGREGRLPELVILGVSGVGLRDRGEGESAYLRSPMGLLFSRCQGDVVEGYEATVDCQAGLVSALWRWRGRPDRIARAMLRPLKASKRWGSARRDDGFSEGKPRPVEKIAAQVAAGLDRLDQTIEVGPLTAERYRRIRGYLEAHGVAVMGVSIPYAPLFMEGLEERMPGFNASWQDAIGRLSAGSGIPFVDPVAFGPWWGDGSNKNLKHLSREGAIDFTNQLWDTPAFRQQVLAGLASTTP